MLEVQGELFSPERLRLARQRRGFFAQEVAARVEVSPKTMSDWERGRTPPTEHHVIKLASVLEFPVEYFFGDTPPVLQDADFRSLARMTARQRDMALGAGCQAIALDGWIGEKFSRPSPNVPDLRESDPEGAAEAVRADWNIGYRPIGNMVHLLEGHGVRVYSLVHEGSEIDAFSVWYGETPFIFLNTVKSAERSRMDAAHELGHLVLHAHTAGGTTKQHENEAQSFAAAFLMPRAPFIATAPRTVNLATIAHAKQEWGVSAMAYLYRLRALGRVAEWLYRRLCIQIRSKFGAVEPPPHRLRETSQVLSKVLSSPGPKAITPRKEIAEALRIHLGDLDAITFGLALTPIAGGGAPPSDGSVSSTQGGGLKLMK